MFTQLLVPAYFFLRPGILLLLGFQPDMLYPAQISKLSIIIIQQLSSSSFHATYSARSNCWKPPQNGKVGAPCHITQKYEVPCRHSYRSRKQLYSVAIRFKRNHFVGTELFLAYSKSRLQTAV